MDVVEADDVHGAHHGAVRGWEQRLDKLREEYALERPATERLRDLLLLLAVDRHAPTAIRSPDEAVDAHVADSLSGLRVGPVREACSAADLGSGAGFPGLVLAVARPSARVTLVESARRKAAWLERTAATLGLENVAVASTRVEEWQGGPVALVTARALAALSVLVEYAAPLLGPEGHLVAWKGTPAPAEEADGRSAAEMVGLAQAEVVVVKPFRGVRGRRLYVYRKVRPTPSRYPRRPGTATKRPLRADSHA